MRRLLLLSLAIASALFAADGGWSKLSDLKTGTELQIFKKGSTKPVLAAFADATDDNLVIMTKNEQHAIAKDDIERIDYRPPAKKRMTHESKTTTVTPRAAPSSVYDSRVPTTSSSGTVGFGSKADFETIYRRPESNTAK